MIREQQWEIAEITDIPPGELIAPPRWRCTIDGTRVWTPRDAALHDEHFHPKVVDEPGRAEPDSEHLRREALDQAARVATGRETQEQLVQRAQAFEAFLRGDALAATTRTPAVGAAPDFVHEAIDRAWSTLREDESGLKALEGEDGDEDVLEVLRGATDEDLRRASFVAQILRTLAQSTRSDRG